MKISIPKRYSASIDLNNTPPSFSVTTTAVEAPPAAIAGAEFLDAAPFDTEEVQVTGQLATILGPGSEGTRIRHGICSRIRHDLEDTTQRRKGTYSSPNDPPPIVHANPAIPLVGVLTETTRYT